MDIPELCIWINCCGAKTAPEFEIFELHSASSVQQGDRTSPCLFAPAFSGLAATVRSINI